MILSFFLLLPDLQRPIVRQRFDDPYQRTPTALQTTTARLELGAVRLAVFGHRHVFVQ